MTVTITQNLADIAGVADNDTFVFRSPVTRLVGSTVVGTRPKRVTPVAGVLTVQLEPGPCTVSWNRGIDNVQITVPGTDSDLWSLVAAGIAAPPTTSADALAAAIGAYLTAHPPSGGSTDEYHEYANQAAFPGTGVADRIYVALDTGQFFRWTGSAYNEESIGQLPLTPTAVKTSAYTAAVQDLIPCDATSAAFPVTLPSAPADKSRVVVKKIDASANAVTVTAGGSDVFNAAGGSTTLSLGLQFQAVQLQYKASGGIWYVVSTDVPLAGTDARYQRSQQVDIPVGLGGTLTDSALFPMTSVGTARVPYYAPVACTNIRLVYTNWTTVGFGGATGDVAGLADLPIKVGLEVGGTIYRATFNGKVDATVSPLGVVTSDPIGVTIAAGTWFYVRTYINGISYYPNHYSYISGSGGFDATGTDLSAPGSGTIAEVDGTGVAFLHGPSVILGTPTASTKTVYGVGDSILYGDYDGTQLNPYNATYDKAGRGGFLARAAKNQGFGLVNAGVGGEGAVNWGTAGWASRRLQFAKYCRTTVCNEGNNDVFGGATLATAQANLIALWTRMNQLGHRVFQTNMVPRTTSTDGWVTTGNQTTLAAETVRVQMNAWLRDGAPMSSGAAVATGTSGASRCAYFSGNTIVAAASGAAHPLYGTVEFADTAESARDSGKWKTPYTSRSVSDAVATAGLSVTSATAAFTTTDLGRLAIVAGAGTSGGLYIGIITRINSATSVFSAQNAISTTVSGASLKIIDPVTFDGTHPAAMQHEELAAQLPTNYFL